MLRVKLTYSGSRKSIVVVCKSCRKPLLRDERNGTKCPACVKQNK